MKLRNFVVSCALAGAAAFGTSSANAGLVLFDNFDSGTATANWPGDSLFVPVVGSVDLVGPGFFQSLANPPGNSVDLNGSTGMVGTLQSTGSFGPGNYTLSFLLAGNMRGDPANTTTISLGSWSTALTLSSSVPYTPETFTFTTTGGKLSFANDIGAGGNPNIGNLLDNVSLTAVPELSTWAMMLLGFAGLGFVGYRASRKSAALAAA